MGRTVLTHYHLDCGHFVIDNLDGIRCTRSQYTLVLLIALVDL